MAPTPNFLFGAAPEDTSAHAIASDLSDARVRRQAASGERRRQAASRGGGGDLCGGVATTTKTIRGFVS